MQRSRKISVFLLSISAILGLVRGFRMAMHQPDDSLLFPYPQEMIKVSVFSSYAVLGWVVFFLVGVFSVVAIICTLYKTRNFAYFIIVEGVFLSFFTVIHWIAVGFLIAHACMLTGCVLIFILGIQQVPKEF